MCYDGFVSDWVSGGGKISIGVGTKARSWRTACSIFKRRKSSQDHTRWLKVTPNRFRSQGAAGGAFETARTNRSTKATRSVFAA